MDGRVVPSSKPRLTTDDHLPGSQVVWVGVMDLWEVYALSFVDPRRR